MCVSFPPIYCRWHGRTLHANREGIVSGRETDFVSRPSFLLSTERQAAVCRTECHLPPPASAFHTAQVVTRF